MKTLLIMIASISSLACLHAFIYVATQPEIVWSNICWTVSGTLWPLLYIAELSKRK